MRFIPLLLACLLAGGAWGAAAAEPPGRALFDAAGCRSCHRVGASGGNAGPDLSLVGFRRSRDWLELWLADPRAWKHDTLMPNFRLRPAARAALAGYLSSLQGEALEASGRPWKSPSLTPGSAEQGRAIYLHAGCVACHGPQGRGGQPNNNVPGGIIPALDLAAQTFTPAELRAKIKNGSRPAKKDPAGPEPLAAMPAWGRALDDGEIAAVSAYLLSLSSPRAKDLDW